MPCARVQHPTRLKSRVALRASPIVIQCLTLATTGSELFEYGKPLSEIALGNSPTVLAAQVCSIPCAAAAAALNPCAFVPMALPHLTCQLLCAG